MVVATYTGSALAEGVIKPSIELFDKATNGERVINLYTADELVPQGELFRAEQDGTFGPAQSGDDSMAAPVDVSAFATCILFASRYSLDVSVLWNHWFLMQAMAPPEVSLMDIYRSIFPVAAMMLIEFVLLMIFPQNALWLPNLYYGQ